MGLQPHGKNSINQPDPQNSQGLSHQQRSTHGSSCICSRGWPCQASMGEVLGPIKARKMPQYRGIKGREVGVSEWVEEQPSRSRGREDGVGVFQKAEKPGKGITFEM